MSDQTPDHQSDDDLLQDVLAIVNALARKSAGGDYLYRGEPECYPKVSSGLYRKYEKTAAGDFDIGIVQRELLQSAKEFVRETGEDEDEVLDQLQHFGYTTNLIDFTTDYHIALFFACDGEPEKDGRVIFLDKNRNPPRTPKVPDNRVIAQKSMFVQPTMGFVEPSQVVIIPQVLKNRILKYLDQAHGISAATIYNDLHGFIRYHGTHDSAYAAFYRGVIHNGRGEYDAAIESYSESIKLNPTRPETHTNRGIAYWNEGDYCSAIRDHNMAIRLNAHYAIAYNNRAIVHASIGDNDLAIQDYDAAIELDPLFALAYLNRGIAQMSQGHQDRAIEDYDIAIELDPHNALAYANRAGAHGRKGDHRLVIQDCNKAIDLDPQLHLAYHHRGVARMSTGDHELAIQDCDMAVELDPTTPLHTPIAPVPT